MLSPICKHLLRAARDVIDAANASACNEDSTAVIKKELENLQAAVELLEEIDSN
jgi:hypothetical protein